MRKLLSRLDTSAPLSHLETIGMNLLEIYMLKKKRVGDTMLQNIWKEVDLEKAWPSAGQLLTETYHEFCTLSEELHVAPETLEVTYGFRESIEVFLRQIDRVNRQLTSTNNAPPFNKKKLDVAVRKLLKIQQSINRIHKYILKDFNFFSAPQIP